jgi:hypothetical protein
MRAFHRQRLDRRAGIFDGMAACAVRPQFRDPSEREVLCAHPRPEAAGDGDAQRRGLLLPDGLGRQHMRHLRRADPEGQRAEGAVGGGVAVAAIDQKPGQRQPLFRPDHVHDALPWVVEAETGDAMGPGVLLQRVDHARDRGRARAAPRRRVVVHHAVGQARFGHAQPALRDLGEGVVRPLVDKMPVHPQKRRAIVPAQDLAAVPELVE